MFFAALGIAVAVLACREITAPLFAPHTSQYQNGTGTVIVSPANMRGWAFYNDQADAPCTDTSVCRLVQGPGSPSAGTGSAELATGSASDGVALVLQDYKGTRLDSITDLHYSTYRQTADAGNNFAIALQFNVDYDLADQASGYQGRLVYEPYQGVGGNVPQNTWQSWDAKAGKWWGTVSGTPEHTQKLFELGAKFICHGCDLIMVKQGMEQIQQRYAPLGFTFENCLAVEAARLATSC